MDYDKMADRLYLSLPKGQTDKERFEMPRLESLIQGKKTFISNFSQALKTIGREERHFYKYITKETASGATIEKGTLVLNGKFGAVQLDKLFTNYVKTYVLCPECGKPDTKISEQQGVKIMKCEACGAMGPLRKL